MVSVVPVCVKSAATVRVVPGLVATVSVTASLDLADSVAVTVEMPPASVIDGGVSTSAAVGRVICAPFREDLVRYCGLATV